MRETDDEMVGSQNGWQSSVVDTVVVVGDGCTKQLAGRGREVVRWPILGCMDRRGQWMLPLGGRAWRGPDGVGLGGGR